MGEKREFLANIQAALWGNEMEVREAEQCSSIFDEQDDTLILERIKYRNHVEKQTLLQKLHEYGEQLHLGVQSVASPRAAADTIVGIIQSSSPEFTTTKQVVLHDHEEIVELQLWKRLAGEAVQVHTTYPADAEIREKTIESYIGITSPKWVVAESATIVQLTDTGQPRSTSLLPSIHIALVRLKNIVANLSELYALLRQEKHKDSFTLISGPSKTADIEAHMVHGAHGPKEMHLIVIDEQMVSQASLKGSGLFSSGEDRS